MARKKERLIYDPLYRLKPAEGQEQTSRKDRARVWTAVVRILSLGFAGK
jgi:hypothetical protein